MILLLLLLSSFNTQSLPYRKKCIWDLVGVKQISLENINSVIFIQINFKSLM